METKTIIAVTYVAVIATTIVLDIKRIRARKKRVQEQVDAVNKIAEDMKY